MTWKLTWAVALGASLAGAVHAQGRPGPDDPAAPVAPVPQRSAFDVYRPYRDEPVAPWKDVNDTVGRVGGHSGVLRAEKGEPAQSAPHPRHATPGEVPAGEGEKKQ